MAKQAAAGGAIITDDMVSEAENEGDKLKEKFQKRTNADVLASPASPSALSATS